MFSQERTPKNVKVSVGFFQGGSDGQEVNRKNGQKTFASLIFCNLIANTKISSKSSFSFLQELHGYHERVWICPELHD